MTAIADHAEFEAAGEGALLVNGLTVYGALLTRRASEGDDGFQVGPSVCCHPHPANPPLTLTRPLTPACAALRRVRDGLWRISR